MTIRLNQLSLLWTLAVLGISMPLPLAAQAPPTPGPEYYVGQSTFQRMIVEAMIQPPNPEINIYDPTSSCGRPYYLDGKLLPNPGASAGTFEGKMMLCLSDEFKSSCPQYAQALSFNVPGVKGDWYKKRTAQGDQIVIQITFEREYWIKQDCKFKEKTAGNDTIILTPMNSAPRPTVPGPSGGQPPRNPGRGTTDDIIDGILYFPPSHPMNPANR